jgi:hypothetical protein
MLDILFGTGIIAVVDGERWSSRDIRPLRKPLILVQLPYFFILLDARNNGGLFSVPAPPTYASERRGFLLEFRPHFFSSFRCLVLI